MNANGKLVGLALAECPSIKIIVFEKFGEDQIAMNAEFGLSAINSPPEPTAGEVNDACSNFPRVAWWNASPQVSFCR